MKKINPGERFQFGRKLLKNLKARMWDKDIDTSIDRVGLELVFGEQ